MGRHIKREQSGKRELWRVNLQTKKRVETISEGKGRGNWDETNSELREWDENISRGKGRGTGPRQTVSYKKREWVKTMRDRRGRGIGTRQTVAAPFDRASLLVSMIAPVKKSVDHLRTVASMRKTQITQHLPSAWSLLETKIQPAVRRMNLDRIPSKFNPLNFSNPNQWQDLLIWKI